MYFTFVGFINYSVLTILLNCFVLFYFSFSFIISSILPCSFKRKTFKLSTLPSFSFFLSFLLSISCSLAFHIDLVVYKFSFHQLFSTLCDSSSNGFQLASLKKKSKLSIFSLLSFSFGLL